MTSIVTEWGKKCLEQLIKRAIKEARYVFCFTCIAKEFEEERARLEAERITLRQRVKVAKGRNKEIKANVVFWEEEVDKLIQEDTKIKQTCFFGFCPDCIWRYKKGKEWANNTEEIKRQIVKGDKFESIELPRLPPGVERNSSQDYISFKSRESKYKELLDALKDDNNYITGLQGMGGTGKTTLAKEVGKEVKESGQFSHVIDTTVSFTPDIKKIQDDIAGPLGLKWEDCNESDRPKTLWDRLTNGEKILLILDDVWDQDSLLDFDAIGIPKRDNHKGCRVLVTTRSKQIFNKMNFDKSIELGLLSEEDAWIMFKMYAGISNSSLKHLTEKGRKIAKECKQLPVAIAVIASSLKGQQHRVHEWDVTLTSLKKNVSMHGVDDDMVGIYKCLKFSYDHMKDEKAKGLFLLCSVFPEDEEISDEVLTRFCIGAGLFGEDYGNYDDARNQVVVAKNKLLDSCLLSEVGEKLVKMHDLIRDVAQWIARKEIRGVNLSNKNQKSLIQRETNIKCLLLQGNYMDLFFCKFDASKLETLIVVEDRDEDFSVDSYEDNKCREIPNSFFENIVKLRVLYLSCYGNRSLSLPNSFQSLTNIRSMSVQVVDLGDISTLGNLQSLEALELVACTINELPSEITKLEKFKFLKLDNCEIRMHNPFEVIKRCSSLEELYFINSFNDFCRKITLPELQRYHIRRGFYEIYDSLSKYVVFDGEDNGYFTKGTLKYCMQTAEVLRLTKINSEQTNLMHEIVGIERDMNDPVELNLRNDSQLHMETTEDLRQTKIKSDLNDPVELHLRDDSQLQCLTYTEPKYCMEIEEARRLSKINSGWRTLMPEMVPIEHGMNDLVELHLVDDPELQCLIDSKHVDSQVPNVVFSKLVVLHLEQMKKLEELCNGSISLDSLNNLEELSIVSCQHLRSLFKCSLNLCNLKTLRLGSCSTLVSVFDLTTSRSLLLLETLHILNCKQLESIITSERRVDDTIDEIDDGDNDNNSSCNSMFPKLKDLFIYSCPKLQFILPFHSPRDHLLLESIGIASCNELKYIFGQHQDVQFASLKQLELEFLPNFIDIFPESHHSKPSSIKSSSNSISKTQTHLEPIKSNIFSWSNICCQPKSLGSTSTEISLVSEGQPKDLSFSLELKVDNSKVESICRLNDISERHMNLGLQNIKLHKLPTITCLFKGLKNSFSLKNLTNINIMKCEKLKIVFSTSIIMCLPQLLHIRIVECNELKHIIEDDLENVATKTVCFPKLKTLVVIKCKMLKYVFPISICKELPELDAVMISEADELEEIFVSEGYERVNIPKLKLVAFVDLPFLGQNQGIHFQAVQNRVVQNCQQLSLTSALTEDKLFYHHQPDHYFYRDFDFTFYKLQQETRDRDTYNGNPSSKTTEDIAAGIEVPVTSEHMDLINQQDSHGETDTTIKPSHGNNNLEGSTSEKPIEETLSTISRSPPIQVVDTKQKGIEITIEEGTTLKSSTHSKPTSSSSDILATSNHITISQLEGSTSEKLASANLSTISETINEPPIQLDAPKQKGYEISFEEGTTSICDKTITSSTHLEVGDGKICIPSSSIVDIKLPATKYVAIGDSQETNVKDINKLIEEDPLLALEKLLTGQVSIYSIQILLQDLKTLMNSSPDLDHLVSNQESKSKLIYLFHSLNQHQGLLPSDMKEFVEKVHNLFNDNIIKYATSEQVLKKHKQLLDSKTDLINKLWTAKSTQNNLDGESSTVNAQIHELSLQLDELRKKSADLENQIDDLKSVLNKCDVKKNKLKAECTEWAQQSEELLSALASSEGDVREVEHARNLATEDFANLKSLFPTF